MHVDANQKSALAAVDVDPRQRRDTLFEIDRYRLSGTEGRGAAHEVARMPMSRIRVAGRDVFAAGLAGEIPGRDFAVSVLQADQRLPSIIFEDDRLDDEVLIDAEALRGMRRAPVLDVVIEVRGEIDTSVAQRADRGGHGVVAILRHRVESELLLLSGCHAAFSRDQCGRTADFAARYVMDVL